MNNYLLGLVEEMRLFLPELRGLMILTPDGLPFDFVILNKNSKEDPIIIGGLISFAVSSLSKALEGFGDEKIWRWLPAKLGTFMSRCWRMRMQS